MNCLKKSLQGDQQNTDMKPGSSKGATERDIPRFETERFEKSFQKRYRNRAFERNRTKTGYERGTTGTVLHRFQRHRRRDQIQTSKVPNLPFRTKEESDHLHQFQRHRRPENNVTKVQKSGFQEDFSEKQFIHQDLKQGLRKTNIMGHRRKESRVREIETSELWLQKRCLETTALDAHGRLRSKDRTSSDVRSDVPDGKGSVQGNLALSPDYLREHRPIERIQNWTLYQQYMAMKNQLDIRNPGTQNERKLWHGTALGTIASINMHGFNRSYCGKNATKYGEGVYFAVSATYSANNTYSPKDGHGLKRMYLAKVLTGNFTKGSESLKVPPAISPTHPHILYDSVVDDVTAPNMFVIFKDVQAYPEYLVTFTE